MVFREPGCVFRWHSEAVTPFRSLFVLPSNALEETQRWAVLLAGHELNINSGDAARLSHFAQPAQHLVLYAASQDTAAQKKRFDRERVIGRTIHHRSHQTVVAEAVTHRDRQTFQFTHAPRLSNLVLVAAQCGAIELIGAVRELRYPGQLFGCQRFNIDLQPQPREESLQRWRFLAKAVALPVLAVERGALTVLFGNLLFVECPDVLKEVRNCLRLIRKL